MIRSSDHRVDHCRLKAMAAVSEATWFGSALVLS
jgi:hypothetical protein